LVSDIYSSSAAVSVATVLLVSTFTATAGDVAAGRQKAIHCQACHGLDGLSKLPTAPHLAGQNETHLIKALKDYRSGARKNEVMSIVASSLTDADINDLAAYYHSIKTIDKPPE
jgi:cytochrome c553